MSTLQENPKDFSYYLDRANALLTGKRLPDGGSDAYFQKRYSQIKMAEPGVYLAHVLEAFPDLDEKKVGEIFYDALTRQSFSGYSFVPHSSDWAYSRVEEFSFNLLRLAAGLNFTESDRMKRYIEQQRTTLDEEGFKTALLPVFSGINKALAARTGATMYVNDATLFRNLNEKLGIDNSSFGFHENVWTKSYIHELLEAYENDKIRELPGENKKAKKEIIIPRLQKIEEKIRSIGSSFSDVRFFLPPLNRQNRLISYDIEVQLDFIEEQIKYFEQYSHNKKRAEAAQEALQEAKKEQARVAQEQEVAGQLAEVEGRVAQIQTEVGKFEGNGGNSIANVRTQAEQLTAFLKFQKTQMKAAFEKIKAIKLGWMTKNATYLDGIKEELRILANGISWKAFDHAQKRRTIQTEPHPWEKHFEYREFALPTTTGEQRLKDMKALESAMNEHKNGKLNPAHVEATQVLGKLKAELDSLVSAIDRVRRYVDSLSPDMKAKDLVAGIQRELNEVQVPE